MILHRLWHGDPWNVMHLFITSLQGIEYFKEHSYCGHITLSWFPELYLPVYSHEPIIQWLYMSVLFSLPPPDRSLYTGEEKKTVQSLKHRHVLLTNLELIKFPPCSVLVQKYPTLANINLPRCGYPSLHVRVNHFGDSFVPQFPASNDREVERDCWRCYMSLVSMLKQVCLLCHIETGYLTSWYGH